jgi:hypothetical protein
MIGECWVHPPNARFLGSFSNSKAGPFEGWTTEGPVIRLEASLLVKVRAAYISAYRENCRAFDFPAPQIAQGGVGLLHRIHHHFGSDRYLGSKGQKFLAVTAR